MIDEDRRLPFTPPDRKANRYAAFKDFKKEITAQPDKTIQPQRQDIFSMSITAAKIKEGPMEEQSLEERQLIFDMVFKPIEPGLRLRPEETQLLLAYIGEILKEIEEEEQRIIEEEKTTQKAKEEEPAPCK